MKHIHRHCKLTGKTIFSILAILFLFVSCDPKVSTNLQKSYPPIDYNQDIMVLGLNQSIPAEVEEIGKVKIGDTGFSIDCDFSTVLDKAKMEARTAGGNLIKITEHKSPSAFGSTCHRLKALILRANKESLDSLFKEEDVENSDYATLYVYRYDGPGYLIDIKLYLDDSLICRIPSGSFHTIILKKEGRQRLWARTEALDEVFIDVEFGKTYFLRCSLSMGAFVGHPELKLVDYYTGKLEYSFFNP